MDLTPIFIFGLPLLLLIAVGLVGSTRRLGLWWTLLVSVLLTPIGGFLVAVLTGPRRPRRPSQPPPATVPWEREPALPRMHPVPPAPPSE